MRLVTFAVILVVCLFSGQTNARAAAAEESWNLMVALAKSKGIDVTWNKLAANDDHSLMVEGIAIKFKDSTDPIAIGKLDVSGIEGRNDQSVVIKSMVLSNLMQIGKDKLGNATSLAAKTLKIENAMIAVGKSYQADKIDMEGMAIIGMDKQKRPVLTSLDSFNAIGIYHPEPTNLSAPLSVYRETGINFTNFKFAHNGAQLIEIPTGWFKSTCDEKLMLCEAEASFDPINIKFPDSSFPTLKDRLATLGIADGMTMSSVLKTKADFTSGILDVEEYRIGIKELGALNWTTKIEGVDEKFLQESRKAEAEFLLQQQKPKVEGAPPQPPLPSSMANLIKQLKLANASIRFDDQSVTNKLLDMKAKETGATRKELADSMPMMASIVLDGLKNPEFARATKQAITDYFANPGNLTIAANPAEPLSFDEIMLTSKINAPSLIDLLKITVTANQPN